MERSTPAWIVMLTATLSVFCLYVLPAVAVERTSQGATGQQEIPAAPSWLNPESHHTRLNDASFDSGGYHTRLEDATLHSDSSQTRLDDAPVGTDIFAAPTDGEPSGPSGPPALWQSKAPPGDYGCAQRVSDCNCGYCDDCVSCCCDSGRLWVKGEYLLWWTRGNRVPPLVSTSPPGTPSMQAGVLGTPGARVLFGGQRVDTDERYGGRLSVGYWLDDAHRTAFEASYFTIGDGDNSGNFTAQSTGTPILARPFINAFLNGRSDSSIVAFPNFVSGLVAVSTSSELHSASLSLRQNWYGDFNARVDLIGGYRYFRFREGLAIREDLLFSGVNIDRVDRFVTENDFHGVELGFVTEFEQNCWSLEFLTKIALGNVNQVVNVSGETFINNALRDNSGLLALRSNIGEQSADELAILPELGINFRYQATRSLSLTLGYSLLYLSEIVRTGDQIDTTLNPTQLLGGNLVGPNRPLPQFNATDLWAQGFGVGLQWER